MFVNLAVENTKYSFDTAFTYKVPTFLESEIAVGKRVVVPFGKGDKTRVGIILGICDALDNDKIKYIKSVLDKNPVLSAEMLALANWMKTRYFCTLFDCIKLMLPAGISYKIKFVYRLINEIDGLNEIQNQIVSLIKSSKKELSQEEICKVLDDETVPRELKNLVSKSVLEICDNAKRKTSDASEKMIEAIENCTNNLSPKQEQAYNSLLEIGVVSVKEFSYFTGISLAVIKALVDKGGARIFDKEKYRRPKNILKNNSFPSEIVLSEKQEEVYQNLIKDIESGEKLVSMLYGVTGSGKTSVFLKLIDYVVKMGKEVILMVPEIALTPQTIDLFKEKFASNIAIFHSALSVGERLDEWKRVDRGECKIVIGTRSAVFAPFKNLGLIVIDEEQEHTYKSETTPRYNAKDIAKFRTAYSKSFCLLSSATPSVESYFMAKSGRYNINKLENRFGTASLPEVSLVDMNQEEVYGNKTDISIKLKNALIENLENKKQSIILLNRRGYQTFARCSSCHTVITCPHCSISLTLHSANNRLMCHYCGYSVPVDTVCPECKSDQIQFSGYGTQRAEETLLSIVPNARILRIDADSTSARYSLEKKLDEFANFEYDIMVGTQMVAKGLNFENVTLVGVLSIDQSLLNDDFRSSERTFDLLTQVVGRSGRGKYKGQAIIQTYIPENTYLRLSAMQDYDSFYNMEIAYRKAMLYPPFVDLMVIVCLGENENQVRLCSEIFLKKFTDKIEQATEKLPIRVLRPSPATVLKVCGKYRYKLIIKCKNTLKFREIISELMKDFAKDKDFLDVTVYADLNPYNII